VGEKLANRPSVIWDLPSAVVILYVPNRAAKVVVIAIIAAVPAAAAALLALTQTVEKWADFSLNRELLRLQVDKLRRELDSSPAKVPRGGIGD
jgi:hypothetical protein